MHDTLVLPQGLGSRGPVALIAQGGNGVRCWLDSACEEVLAQPGAGDREEAALVWLALQLDGADAIMTSAAARIADEDAQGLAHHGFALLWAAAGAAMDEGHPLEAVALLLIMAVSPDGRADGLLGLAVCAARLDRFADARALALASREAGASHPRVLCVAGLCALREGDRRVAQSYLATAARMARRRSEFRDDLQLAQRQLLLMHLA